MNTLRLQVWGKDWPLDRWRALATAIRRDRGARRDRSSFAALDDRTCRDIGMDRSEYGSYLAEAAGIVDASRRRLASST